MSIFELLFKSIVIAFEVVVTSRPFEVVTTPYILYEARIVFDPYSFNIGQEAVDLVLNYIRS